MLTWRREHRSRQPGHVDAGHSHARERHQKGGPTPPGKLNRERARAPRGVIANEAWVADGETIRALGAPMGNNFDETAWWKGRYRTIKSRIATWPGMRRLSIRGRNLLLQSIFYGSFLYWLYFLIMPDPIIKIIELDAKQILWASDPTLRSNEEGTSKRARRWTHEMASYFPWSKGGAGILHWESHCKAFYASWIVRFLDPRRAPWKDILRHWISDEYIHEAIILSSASPNDAGGTEAETGGEVMHQGV